MVNKKTNRALEKTVSGAVWWAVDRAVEDAVSWAAVEDPPHPALQDFLRFADVEKT